jgi:hypothetical protein
VPHDGRHLGLIWERSVGYLSTVVIFRRKAPPGIQVKSNWIHVVDQLAQIIPAFMYPDTFRTQYYPAFDASNHPIPPGTQLGVWTVVGSVDGDPVRPFIDTVEPGVSYMYALVPAERGAAPDTYESLEGAAALTPPISAPPASLIHVRWFQAVLAAATAALLAAIVLVIRRMRRSRAGAAPSGEAS